jgi:hypothetical protein
MSKVEDGWAAFPNESNLHVDQRTGMSLRDYFAAKAMQGFLSDPNVTVRNDMGARLLAKSAFGVADAMLAARSKP